MADVPAQSTMHVLALRLAASPPGIPPNYVRIAQSHPPYRDWSDSMTIIAGKSLTAAGIAAVVIMLGASVFAYPSRHLVRTTSTYDEACTSGRAYALLAFRDENYQNLTLEDCGTLSSREQDDGTWLTSGTTAATQYSRPVTIRWSVRTAAMAPDGVVRVCDFALTHATGMLPLKSFDVADCGR
jgi:hypothetical protein